MTMRVIQVFEIVVLLKSEWVSLAIFFNLDQQDHDCKAV